MQTKKDDASKDDAENEDAKELAQNIKDAIARGDIQVETLGSNVVINFTPTKADEKELPNLLQETLNSIESVKHQVNQILKYCLEVWRSNWLSSQPHRQAKELVKANHLREIV